MCFESAIRVACMIGSGLCLAGNQTVKLMKKDVKMAYGLLVLFFSVLLLVIVYWGGKYLNFASNFINCPNDVSLDVCLGLSAVYRLSAVLAFVHLIVGLCCLTRDGFAKAVNEGLWGIKILLTAGLFIGSLFIDNKVFEPYARASIYLGGVFLFVQAVSLIDAFYLWAEFWAKKFDDGNNCYGCLLIFTSLLMYALTGFFVYLGFKNYWAQGCFSNRMLLIIPVIFVIAFTVLIILRFHPKGSIITSGAISIFGAYLFWAALISNPDEKCNPDYSSKTNMFIQIGFSYFFAFMCNLYWSLSTKPSSAYQSANLPAPAATEGDSELETKAEQENKNAPQETNLIKHDNTPEQYEEYENNSYLKFHCFMVLFSIYICAVFTNWGHATVSEDSSRNWNYQVRGDSSPYYIKVFIGIFTFGLYLWTIVAPTLFPDRNFDT